MGGTVPAIGQAVIRDPARLGRTGALLYAVNTLGAALGVAIAAFVLVPSFGYRATYTIAVMISVGVGIVAWRMPEAGTLAAASKKKPAAPAGADRAPAAERFAIATLCFISGFVILALEVVWTRIFAQVHENSVYSYAIILIIVLIGLAAGAAISSVVSQFAIRPWLTLGMMTLAGAGLLVLGPSMLMVATDGLRPVDSIEP